jgi:hypothetical protein
MRQFARFASGVGGAQLGIAPGFAAPRIGRAVFAIGSPPAIGC